MSCDILQIAAISGSYEFSVYIHPTQSISSNATKINGLSCISGELFYGNKKVDAENERDALLSFSQFLKVVSTTSLLVAHNARFDVPRITEAIIRNKLCDEFKNVSFADTLPFFKKELTDRKGAGAFTLSNLARDLLGTDNSNSAQFHEALFDVTILQKIVNFVGKKGKLFSLKTRFEESVKQLINNKKINTAIVELGGLKTVISRGILRKIADTGITLENLRLTLRNGGEQDVITLLSKKCDDTNKPLVTKDKKVINKIITFLNSS